MSAPRFFFLGKPQFELDGQPVELTSAKAIALLGYLAVSREPQPRERLLGLLWAESSEEAARKNLRNTLWTIRKTLGDDVLNADDDHLAIADSAWVDVREFELVTSHFELSIPLFRGPFLDGLVLSDAPDFEIWLTGARERLSEAYSRALSALVDAYRAAGHWREVIAVAQRALAHDALQEPMARALMDAHARLGERAEALRHYETLRATLERELGVPPLPETQQLRAAIVAGAVGATLVVALAPGQPRGLPLQKRKEKSREPFIGRRAEMLALDAELQAAAAQARIVLLTGEVGIGKSRLWREWSSNLAPRAAILQARCLDSTQALPFAPLAELFGQPVMAQKFDAVSPIWLAEVARLLPQIRATHPNLPAPATLPPDEERRHLFEAFTQCLLALDARPLVVFLDDVHWADRATLDWLGYAAHRLHDRPFLLVLAYRPEDAPSTLAHLVASWGRVGLARRVPLARLTAAESAALIASLGGDPALTERAQTQAAGNPYFLIEMYRALPSDLPPVLSELIRARLDRLDGTARQVLQAAAVLGPDFDFAILRRTSGRSEEETLEALDALLNANVLSERDGRYYFAHPLVAAVVQNSLSGARRAFIHRRAAQALEATFAHRLPQIAGQLAAHYAQAGDVAPAAHYAEMAAERALALAASAEAIDFYRQALALQATPARRMGLGRVLLRQVELQDARATFEAALQEYQATGDRRGAARAALNIAETYYPAGRFDLGRAWTEQALVFVANEDDPESHALARLALASGELGQAHSFEDAQRNLDEATRHAAENHLPDIAARARFVLGNLFAERGELKRALAAYRETIDFAAAAGNDFQQVLGHNNLAYHALVDGDLATAHEHIAAALSLAEERALRLPLQHLYSTRGEIALAEKEWDEAEGWFHRAQAEAEKNHNAREIANARANLALAARGRGDLDGALILLETARDAVAHLQDLHLQIKIDLWLTELLFERGECAAGAESLARAERRLEGGERKQLQAWARRLRSKLAENPVL
ncbi:MAG: AAA family ATPase [Chloroflexi bacterium]|nr:AAA family ATPase [Chloroflexota bacterium]